MSYRNNFATPENFSFIFYSHNENHFVCANAEWRRKNPKQKQILSHCKSLLNSAKIEHFFPHF